MTMFKKEFIEEFINKYKNFFFEHGESIVEREKYNEALLSEFMDRYSLEKFKSITIDDYCFEKGNKNTYTYS